MSSILKAHTPAKLNLGLEVIGRREDGYHDILTVMQTINIFDDMLFEPLPDRFEYLGDPALEPDADIVRPVLEARATELGWRGRLTLRKHIPLAAGLGGGSSDAALALRIAFDGESPEQLERRAATVGADVPFLIRGGSALASGTGVRLTRLPHRRIWFVIAIPDISIPSKTASIYAALEPRDFSTGEAVSRIANALERGLPLPDRLPNTFECLMLSRDQVSAAWNLLLSTTGRAALSGAGPAVFSWFDAPETAKIAAGEIRNRADFQILLAESVAAHAVSHETGPIARALRSGT